MTTMTSMFERLKLLFSQSQIKPQVKSVILRLFAYSSFRVYLFYFFVLSRKNSPPHSFQIKLKKKQKLFSQLNSRYTCFLL